MRVPWTAVLLAPIVIGCVVDVSLRDPVRIQLLADERTAYERARPVFAKRCAHCHSQRGRLATATKLERFDVTSYPFGGRYGQDTSKLRRVLGLDGSPPIMPFDAPGSVRG